MTHISMNQSAFTRNPDKFPLGVGDNGEVVWDRGFIRSRHLLLIGTPETGRNAILRSILKHSAKFPAQYVNYGIDLSGTRLVPYLKYSSLFSGIATTLDESLALLQGIEEEMKNRLDAVELSGVNIEEAENCPRILIVIDEAMDLFLGNAETDEGNPRLDKVQLGIMRSIQNISSVGRLAGITVVLSSKHPAICNAIPGETMLNFPYKIFMGEISAEQASKFDVEFVGGSLNIKDTNRGIFVSDYDRLEQNIQGQEFQLYSLSSNSFGKQFSTEHNLMTGTVGVGKSIRRPMAQDRVLLSVMNP